MSESEEHEERAGRGTSDEELEEWLTMAEPAGSGFDDDIPSYTYSDEELSALELRAALNDNEDDEDENEG
jgi:hypothetical protein